jgi:uncharacterized protein (UPF0335 family)
MTDTDFFIKDLRDTASNPKYDIMPSVRSRLRAAADEIERLWAENKRLSDERDEWAEAAAARDHE